MATAIKILGSCGAVGVSLPYTYTVNKGHFRANPMTIKGSCSLLGQLIIMLEKMIIINCPF